MYYLVRYVMKKNGQWWSSDYMAFTSIDFISDELAAHVDELDVSSEDVIMWEDAGMKHRLWKMKPDKKKLKPHQLVEDKTTFPELPAE